MGRDNSIHGGDRRLVSLACLPAYTVIVAEEVRGKAREGDVVVIVVAACC